MKIRVDEAKKKAVELEEEQPATHYPSLVQLEEAGECRFAEPVRATATARWEYDHVRVQGTVQTEVELTCSRCLETYLLPISADFTIFYTEAKGESLDEEVELSEEELISVPYQGDEIDLDPEIIEQVQMEIPYKPLCSESCKGLCPQCGTDLNSSECGCDRSGINLKMSALKDIKIDKHKGE